MERRPGDRHKEPSSGGISKRYLSVMTSSIHSEMAELKVASFGYSFS